MSEISLALSGGAARGAYHLGVLQFIDEQKIEVKAIAATSIGAIIGASYACGVRPKEQLKIFQSKEYKKIFSLNLFKGSLLKVDYQAKILKRLIPVNNIEDLEMPLYITAVDVDSGEEVCFTQGDIEKICLASSALVPLFPSVEYENRHLIDGGIINHMPIEPLKKYSQPIVGVNLHPIHPQNVTKRLPSMIRRSLQIRAYYQKAQEMSDIYITSPELNNYSLFSFEHLDTMFQMGYRDAKKNLEDYKALN